MSRETTIFPCRTSPTEPDVLVACTQSPRGDARRAIPKRSGETSSTDRDGANLFKEACRRLGKSSEEETKWQRYFKEQWLDGRGTLANLSDKDWEKLDIPIGLRVELRKLVSEPDKPVRIVKQSRSSSGSKESFANGRLGGFRNFESPGWGGVDFSNKLTEMHNKKEMNAIIEEFRNKLKSRKPGDIYSLGRLFRRLDDDGDRKLNNDEFEKLLREIGIRNQQVCALLFQRFDTDLSGTVDYDEFLRAIRGKMSNRRREAAAAVFDHLDSNGDGLLTSEDVNCVNPSNHPDVKAGIRRPEDIFAEVMQVFDANDDGRVSLEEWLEYYEAVSASIDDDEIFIHMLKNVWKMPGSDGDMADKYRARMLRESPTGLW